MFDYYDKLMHTTCMSTVTVKLLLLLCIQQPLFPSNRFSYVRWFLRSGPQKCIEGDFSFSIVEMSVEFHCPRTEVHILCAPADPPTFPICYTFQVQSALEVGADGSEASSSH